MLLVKIRKDKVKICQDGITATTVEIMSREIRLLIALLADAAAAAIAAIDVGLNVGAASGLKARKVQLVPKARRGYPDRWVRLGRRGYRACPDRRGRKGCRGCPDPRDRRDPKGYRA